LGYFLIADKIFALNLTVGLLIGLIFVRNQEDTNFLYRFRDFGVDEHHSKID
jgi:hypothetical protein